MGHIYVVRFPSWDRHRALKGVISGVARLAPAAMCARSCRAEVNAEGRPIDAERTHGVLLLIHHAIYRYGEGVGAQGPRGDVDVIDGVRGI